MFNFSFTYCGKIKELNGQSIKTRIFKVMGFPFLPSLPLQSMFIVNEEDGNFHGFEMKINFLSLLLGYIRGALGFICIIMLIVGLDEEDKESLIYFTVFLVTWILSFFIGMTGKVEKRERELLGVATGIYGYPEWLPEEKALEVFNDLKENWLKNYSEDWKKSIRIKMFENEDIPVLYALSMYNKRLDDNKDEIYLVDAAKKISFSYKLYYERR